MMKHQIATFVNMIAVVIAMILTQSVMASERVENQDMFHERVHVTATIVDADGSPIEGAAVVTSAGGHGVSHHDGVVRFAVDLDPSLENTHVTAVAVIHGVNHMGSVETSLIRRDDRREAEAGVIMLSANGECEPAWVPSFGGTLGMNDRIYALTVFDDGSGGGPAIYAGGAFTMAGGKPANRIAKWDGNAWSAVGTGMNNAVWSLCVFDDGSGSGPALYAGGAFTSAGNAPASRIARWDGNAWTALGSGTNNQVRALAVYDDASGNGPALYVGGTFGAAGGVPANQIAKWDGTDWAALGSGMSGYVYALTVYGGGNGMAPGLYVGGKFATAGDVTVNSIARWDGTSWSALGDGLDEPPLVTSQVDALAVFDDGSGGGPALYVGGDFSSAGGVSANNIARWDGVAWSTLGSGCNNIVRELVTFDDGGGSPALYASGSFTSAGGVPVNRIARWDGSAWSATDDEPLVFATNVRAMTVFDNASGAGPALYVGAQRGNGDDVTAFNGTSWSALGNGFNDWVLGLTAYDDGSGGGPMLYAYGAFVFVDGIRVNRVAKWDGATWTPLGSGMNSWVYALAVFDDGLGSGPALYAAGAFTVAGGVDANRIAKWDGTTWSPLGSGVGSSTSHHVFSLTVFDDGLGGGSALYAGGTFTSAGGQNANRIAKWDGIAWSPVGTGMNNSVAVLTVHDDGLGGGPALYAGGEFTSAGGVSASRIAKWDGTAWAALDGGMNDWIGALTVFDDGSGEGSALYAGGNFTLAGGVSANRIAKWDGTAWSPVGSGVNELGISIMAVFDDGSGPALFAGGRFTIAGDAPAKRVAKWDGKTWSPLGEGLNDWVYAMSVFDDGSGSGEALFVGGNFSSAPDGDSFLTKWHCTPVDNNFCEGAIVVNDGVMPFTNQFATTTGPNEPNLCTFFGDTHVQNDIWFQYEATCSGTLTISTCGSAYSTKLAVYLESCPTTGGEAIVCNAAACQTQAEVVVNATEGDLLLVRVGGHNGAIGQGILTITCEHFPIGDLNNDGIVDVSDLLVLLAAWGPCPDPDNCPEDLDGDGAVDVSDLLILLANWG